MLQSISKVTNTTYFTNAVKVTLAAVIPVLVLSYFDHFQWGFTMALGAIFVYPTDIPSSLQHKIRGMLFTAVLVSTLTGVVQLLMPYSVVFYPLMLLLLFFISMLSVYGQRASMVSFTGLIAISLAFANVSTGAAIFTHAAFVLVGGLFYSLISVIFHFVRPNRYAALEMASCIKLTAKYLKLRGDLWSIDADRKSIIEQQLHLQVDLNTTQQNLREVLIGSQTAAGSSEQNRKMLLIFISLVEIQELALSTAFDHDTLHQKFDAHPAVLRTYQNLAYNLAASLKKLSKNIKKSKIHQSEHTLNSDLNALQEAIMSYQKELGTTAAAEGVLMLTTMLHYAEKQVEKIKIVERAYSSTFSNADWKGIDKDLEKFLTPEYYPWRTLVQNFSFSSILFRHSLRLTLTLAAGFALGHSFDFQNAYWILLTIIVIMRPGYGLTRERSFQRTLGTIFGGVLAFGLLFVVSSTPFLALLSIICMLLGFTFTQVNYKLSATFVTMYVVFIYGILTPNSSDLVQFRILDTAIGATLAFLANYILWPSWEFLHVPKHLEKAIKANQDYLKEIALFYQTKGAITTSYRLARKNAFVETGNLMASFQRMVQEPKSKQVHLAQTYKLVVLNHSLLSSLASMGTYIQSHKTTKASEAFQIVVQAAIQNLEQAILILQANATNEIFETDNEAVKIRFSELQQVKEKEIKANIGLDKEAFQIKMQEAQLIIEQLLWLTNLSKNIVKATKSMQ
ncbi:FUSC family protein [Flavobacterium sp. K77]|uniref:FUSC family membrane protein n=1 Tax=Flavobacterium sp. K77 TaxID=2910676 RepID=UPI001F1FB225|nr:FUSC family membrane protein [Flavobacterium sp. K77]MCF6140910.1 FUSC family protein [Flavobacterium sp. K77]